MELPQTEIVGVIYALLPGFLAAWIFYGLTAHPRKSPFERVVQALIFTGIAQAVVLLLRASLLCAGRWFAMGIWTNDVAYVWSIAVAVLLGLTFALFANKDWFHRFLREHPWLARIGGITTRTSFPSEWFSAFNQDKRYVVLHLTGQRRLYGWPFEWPDSPDSGHFVIAQPEWLLENNQRVPVHTVERMLVAAKDVEMVEFEKAMSEIDASEDEIETAEKTLVELQKEEVSDDSQE